jgi:hypothetical protein
MAKGFIEHKDLQQIFVFFLVIPNSMYHMKEMNKNSRGFENHKKELAVVGIPFFKKPQEQCKKN